MAKGKSSASAGTRKKHARKAAGPAQPPEAIPKEKKPKGKDKGKNKEPRQKIYIPPVKPAPIQPDPLDTMGLAHQLPPELLVVLRLFGKKDAVTKRRALEELQSGWVDESRKEGDDSPIVSTLVTMLPVWLHHVPALFVHPSKRIRLLTSSLHMSLLHIPAVRDQIFFFLRETASTDQAESILGTWCMASHDIDRQVSTHAHRSWTDAIGDDDTKLVLDEPSLLSFVQRALLDPGGVYLYLYPVPPAVAPPPFKKIPGRPVPTPTKREDSDTVPRTKGEGDDENEQDRKARLRVGAFGAITWVLETRAKSVKESSIDDLMDLFCNPALWTSLHHAETSPLADLESFGWNQPIVRKSAWTTLHALLRYWKGSMERMLPTLSTAVLRSAWVEPDPAVQGVMWQPLLTFLKEFSSIWTLAEIDIAGNRDENDSNSEDSEEDINDVTQQSQEAKPAGFSGRSMAYREFLQFLELGCSGSPSQGYPTIVIILSTIPSSILAPLTDFFASFWAAIDGRALSSLDRSATSAAFLSSLFECTIFIIRRLRSSTIDDAGSAGLDQVNGTENAKRLVGEQFGRVWDELVTLKLKVQPDVAAKLMAQTLVSLNKINEDMFRAAWDALATAIKKELHTLNTAALSLISTMLKVFDDLFEDGTSPKLATSAIVKDIAHFSLGQCENALKIDQSEESALESSATSLVTLFNVFGPKLFLDPEFSMPMDDIIKQNAYRLLSVSPPLIIVYLSRREDHDHCLQVWHAVLSGIVRHPEHLHSNLTSLLHASCNVALPNYLKPKANELDALVGASLTDVLSGSAPTERVSLLSRLLANSGYFLSDSGFHALLCTIISAFTRQVDQGLRDSAISLPSFVPPLDLILAVYEARPPVASSIDIIASVLPCVFIFAYLFPTFCGSYHDTYFQKARYIWTLWLSKPQTELHIRVFTAVKGRLRGLIVDIRVRATPEQLLRLISQSQPVLGVDVIYDMFPSPGEVDQMLRTMPSDPIDSSLAVLDTLLPPPSFYRHAPMLTQIYDNRGYSAYARLVCALLQVLTEDRQAARRNFWALRHFLALSIYADDLLQIPTASSAAFQQNTSGNDLRNIITTVHQITTYLLTSPMNNALHLKVVTAVCEDRSDVSLGGLGGFLVDLITNSKRDDNVRDSRILRRVLQPVLSDVGMDEADQWMILARKLEKTAPQTSIAVVSSITQFAPEPPRLDRYKNELAAGLLGIPATKANTEGLLSLQKLAATAPDPMSDVVFLSQTRAVNVVKAFQRRITSDEDIDEEVESEMTSIFLHLAPLLQNVSGAHWEFMFDIIENNLENCTFADDTTLVTLARTLRLIVIIQDLALTTKTLREDWEKRHISILMLVRDLVAEPLDAVGISAPRSVCRELVLSIVQDLPASMIDQDTLSKMCHLLTDSSVEVQKMAYQFLHEAAKKRTEYLVIELGVDTEDAVEAQLPVELIDILQQSLNLGDGFEDNENNLLGYMIGWQLAFDLFTNASLRVRSGYINHIRNLDIIATHFVPNILNLLELYDGVKNAFKLDFWAVDEYYLDFYEPGTSISLQLLGSHLFYRALLTVPSLIRAWLLDCTDRQLSSSVVSYTSQYFSPVIIRTELAHVKSPETVAELTDENMTVKVAQAVNEVTASYLVDEHQLEITLKMPMDWPLHTIEIKDTKKVGVLEDRWRAWVFGVQQIIWSQNGRIVDGLSLFKKNVALHFEGQVECAICYSIISVMDGTLPRKPCRTCKNRFHAGCLYKWFNTSHSSSCPLCRSDIM